MDRGTDCILSGTVKVALMSWWTTKGEYETKLRKQAEELLRRCVRKWGDLLIQVFDRGYASGPWLQLLQSLRVRFVIRWIKKHSFLDANGREKKVWQIGQGKKYFEHKLIYAPQSGVKLPCDSWWAAVRHASSAYQLYVVKVRVRKKVWYLITNEPIKTAHQAWDVVFTYKRRGPIETSFRYGKCELAMESPRLWAFENRLKLLGIVTLVYAFLLHLLHAEYKELVTTVLRLKCHRTGKRYREILAPLYRLRWAISRLWDEYHPILGSVFPPNLQTLQALASFQC